MISISILKVDQGNTGQLLVSIKPLPKARSYELRYASLGAGGMPSPWATATFTSARTAAPVNSLTPGTTYAFQVRALGRLGYTDWSDSATRMCT
ncbi:MAG TPA: fibronectin type III domain-containing protein [Terriglobia bacterium]|nr:fibronectin type III domain-containing protein [Terriglobia bacterium]